MSTIVCQNLLSCFESQLGGGTTTLKLKLVAATPSPAAAALEMGKIIGTDDRPQATNLDFGNWGFLQTTPKESPPHQAKDSCSNSYSKKPSFTRLNEKSLELCTENLGSETGSDILTDGYTAGGIFLSTPPCTPSSKSSGNSLTPSHFNSELENSERKSKSQKKSCHEDENSSRKTKNFPPPLTSMSGSSSLQVRRHREGGRLIIEAVESPFRNSYLQAERSDGRLRLCFMSNFETAASAATSGEEEEKENECGGEVTAADEEFDEPITEFELDNEELDGEMNLEKGMEKFQWLSRCKEGGHGNGRLCNNWKPALWVATS